MTYCRWRGHLAVTAAAGCVCGPCAGRSSTASSPKISACRRFAPFASCDHFEQSTEFQVRRRLSYTLCRRRRCCRFEPVSFLFVFLSYNMATCCNLIVSRQLTEEKRGGREGGGRGRRKKERKKKRNISSSSSSSSNNNNNNNNNKT